MPHLGQKVKVTKSINAEAENALYLPNAEAYELRIWYIDGAQRPTSSTCTMTSKVKVVRSCRHCDTFDLPYLDNEKSQKHQVWLERCPHHGGEQHCPPVSIVINQRSRSPGQLMK